jgi:mRNA interferase MazF
VISADRFNHGPAELVVVLPITTRDKRIPSHVRITKGEAGLTGDSFAKAEEIRCVSKDRLRKRWGRVERATLAEVEKWVRTILQL